MSGSSFDMLTQEILRHKQIMEQLETENRELKQQLADLREARGIFIDICGQRFALMSDSASLPLRVVPAPAPLSVSQPVEAAHLEQAQELLQDEPVAHEEFIDNAIVDAPTVAIMQAQMQPIPETPHAPHTSHTPHDPLVEEEDEENFTPTFLEEIMIDEFVSASTSPMPAVWAGPPKKQEQTPVTTDEEKAALRRELIGSFLLE